MHAAEQAQYDLTTTGMFELASDSKQTAEVYSMLQYLNKLETQHMPYQIECFPKRISRHGRSTDKVQ